MLVPVVVGAGLLLVGCRGGASGSTASAEGGRSTTPRQLKPADFVASEPRMPSAVSPSPASSPPRVLAAPDLGDSSDDDALFADASDDEAAPAPTSEELAAAERLAAQSPRPRIEAATSPPTTAPHGAYTMDAMVGQVNGRAIYANAVFDPLAEQLTALGRTLDGQTFVRRAGELIAGRLDQMITDALILSEAERDLSEGERYGLRAMVQRRREELLRQWGDGSLALAEERLRAETGKSLNETLEAYRQQQLVRRYMMQKIMPLINVTRRDVEQHYREHIGEYQPPVKRTVRLIRVERPADADAVRSELEAGTPFAQVAAKRINQYRPDEGGLWPEPIVGDEGLGGALGEALRDMTAGQHKGPIAFNNNTWWLFVESEDRGNLRPLREVQLDIEKELRQARFRQLSQRYRQRLYDEGSYNEMEKMIASLLDVAVSRYDVPAP
jgi:hypothetical protein